MKKILSITFLLLITTMNYHAAELNYKWKANTIYNFNAVVTDNITTSVMGMNMSEKYLTTVDFVLAISSVDANGTASGRLYLINFNMKNTQGLIIASMANIPKDAIRSDITVDKRGNFTFPKKVTLVTTSTSNVLVYAKVEGNNIQAGGEIDGEKVDAYAEFDPKTGKLKAGYTVASMKTTKKVTVQENEESDEIDVFPYDFLSMLVMPEGNVATNDKYKVRSGLYTVDILAKSVANNLATIEQKITTDKNADMFEGSAEGQSHEGSFDIGTFGGTDGMELTDEDQAAIGMGNSMSPTMDGTMTTNFDYGTGMFINVTGTLNTTLENMGAKMTVKSVLTMKKK
ncbi:MAG: hypothetical protein ACK47F_12410 [Flavobacteriales bacterium]